MRKRVLALSTESARHPFRRQLPRHVLQPAETKGKTAAAASDDADWKLFLLSFSAFFTAFYSFIY